jgi:hypothetical protein
MELQSPVTSNYFPLKNLCPRGGLRAPPRCPRSLFSGARILSRNPEAGLPATKPNVTNFMAWGARPSRSPQSASRRPHPSLTIQFLSRPSGAKRILRRAAFSQESYMGLLYTCDGRSVGRAGERFPRNHSRIEPMNPLCVVPSPSPPHTCGGEGWGEEALLRINICQNNPVGTAKKSLCSQSVATL